MRSVGLLAGICGAAGIGALLMYAIVGPPAEPLVPMAPPALLEVALYGALSDGNPGAAFGIMRAADEHDPELAWQHALTLRGQLKRVDSLLNRAGKQARELLPRLPAVTPKAAYQRLATPRVGTSEIVYLSSAESARGFGQVFEDMTAALGKGSPSLVDDAHPITATQRVVVAPGTNGLTSIPANRVVALAPHAALEAALGLAEPRLVRMDHCVLRTAHEDLALLSTKNLELPLEGFVSDYAQVGKAAETIAVLACADGEHPALFRLQRGGAEPAYMFAFNLLESLVYTRQGDPALKNQEIDGVRGQRPSDLFARKLSAGQLQMPFSDLLMEAVLQLIEGERPTLRLWHNPAGTRGVLIVTSDQDFAPESRMAIMAVALAQWKVPATFYLTSGTYQNDLTQRLTDPSLGFVQRARQLGISFGAHSFLLHEAGKPVAQIITEHVAELRHAYQQPPHSVRFHFARWPGYSEPAESLSQAGYRYDTSYITLNSKHIDGLGYMTGGGLALRYYKTDGVPLGTRQLATQLDDHTHPSTQGLSDEHGKPLTMTFAALTATTKGLLQAAGRRYHSPLTVNNHPWQFADDPRWLQTMIETARVEQLGVLDVEGYDAFVSALRDSSISTADDPSKFHVLVQASEHDIVIRHYAGDSALVDGSPKPLRKVTIFDRPAKMLTLTRGPHDISLL